MVVCAFVDVDDAVASLFDLLFHGAILFSTLVVAALHHWIVLHLLLAVLAPVVPVIERVHIGGGFYYQARRGGKDSLATSRLRLLRVQFVCLRTILSGFCLDD